MKDAPALYIHKTDVGGKELPGAVLSVLDSDGNRIQQWTSTSQPKQLPVTGPDDTLPGGIMLSDETTERVYILHEDAAPAGYRLAQDIQFKVLRTPENKLTVYYRADPNDSKRGSEKKSQSVMFNPSHSFLIVVMEICLRDGSIIRFRPLMMLFTVDWVTPLMLQSLLMEISRSLHNSKIRSLTASPMFMGITSLH